MAVQRHRWVVGLLFVCATFLTGARVASAEPVPITSGFITLNWDGCCGGLRLIGPGLSISMADSFHVTTGLTSFRPGETVDPDLTVRMTGRGGARINGELITTPEDGTSFGMVHFGGNLFFDTAPFVAIDRDPNATHVSFSTTFTMTGIIAGYATPARTGTPLFSVPVIGQGTAGIFNMRRFDEEIVLFAPVTANRSFTFQPADQAPVPEPASMLLIGTGLCGVLLRRRAGRTPS